MTAKFVISAIALAVLSTASLGQQVSAAATRPVGTAFRDCPDCPEMVVLRGGDFTMGSSLQEKQWAASHGGALSAVADEAPQHSVHIRSFAIGKTPITRREYAIFARATGHAYADGCGRDGEKWEKRAAVTWESPGFSQTDDDPVVCVSWYDARAYVDWLNSKFRAQERNDGSGPYRLPSEAEWEYAARGGTATRFWWGESDDAVRRAWYKANANSTTHPSGQFAANPFGLYDITGNVWQWTEDCYAASYEGAPTDGSAVERPAPCLRVDRGGSWGYGAWLLRPAARERNPEDYRDTMLGFRVAGSGSAGVNER